MATSQRNSTPIGVLVPFLDERVGGSHLSGLMTARSLDPVAFRCHVVVHGFGPLAERLAQDGVPALRVDLPFAGWLGVGTLRHGLGLLASLWPAMRILKRLDIDVIHTNDERMHALWSLAGRLAGCAVVRHQRTLFPNSGRVRLFARLASRIACVSQFTLNSLPAPLRRKAVCVHDPFEGSDFEPRSPEAKARLAAELGVDASVPLIGLIGNLTAQKRPDVFVRACSVIFRDFSPEARFVMFGADREGLWTGLQDYARVEGFADRLIFMGFRSDIHRCIAGLDLVLGPSVREAFGNASIEATLIGTPVVLSRSGGNPEIVEDGVTGRLVEPDDSDALARAAIDLLRDPDAATAMAIAARQRNRQRFTKERHIAAIEELYHNALRLPAAA
jgi:glycosyltransferase involved in cell wall biosynthesis